MDIINEKIQKNMVEEGQEFSNYKQLCQYIGIPYSQGKQKELLNRHLKCYFTWEKVEGSNRLRILETFYDNPKVFEDRRGGSRAKPTTAILVQYFKQCEWKSGFYSKTDLLRKMGLVPRVQFKESLRTKARSLSNIVYDGITSSMRILMKEYSDKISEEVVSEKEDRILNATEREEYFEIKEEVLRQFGAKSEWDIFDRDEWQSYRCMINKATIERLNLEEVHERYWIISWSAEEGTETTIDNRMVIRTAYTQLLANRKKKMKGGKGGIGVASIEHYQKFLIREARNILNDPEFTMPDDSS